ncbi:MAG TPA: hypothetical protein VIN09_01405 [Chloroflexota bacterium]|jgi:hypothetical protein
MAEEQTQREERRGRPRPETAATEKLEDVRFVGVLDLLPDAVLPQPAKEHLRHARRELFLAWQAWLESAIRGLERRRAAPERRPTRIEVE